MGDVEDLGPGLVLGQRLLKTSQHLLLVVNRLHVDEIDNDDPPNITKSQLSPNFLGCFDVVPKDRVLECLGPNELAGVDINNGQSLGPIDHEMSARWKIDPAI